MRPGALPPVLILFCGLSVANALAQGHASAQEGNCTKLDESSRPDCPAAVEFFHHLQTALRNNDHEAIASAISYPLLTNTHHKKTHIADRKQLLAHFDEIFDSAVRCVILNASEKDVSGNWRGFTVDGGAVWFDVIIPRGERPDINAPDYWKKYPMKIITVNNDAFYSCKP
jgi:hypothetical protein